MKTVAENYTNITPAILDAQARGHQRMQAYLEKSRISAHAEVPQPAPAPVAAADHTAALRAAHDREKLVRAGYSNAANLGISNDVVDQLLDAGVPLDQLGNELVKVFSDQQAKEGIRMAHHHTGEGARVSFLRDDEMTQANAAVDAIAARLTGQRPENEAARPFMGMRIADIASKFPTASGGALSGRWITASGAGMLTTSDFPLLLAAGANKALASSYEAVASPMKVIARQGTLPDFKIFKRVRMGEGPQLLRVNESGEIEHGAFSEAAETVSVASYARQSTFSLQALVNDDLAGIRDTLRQWGQGVAALEADLLVTALSDTLSDGEAVFSVAHANLAGSATTIDVANVALGKKAIRTQTGLDGRIIVGQPPRYLLTGPARELVAQQLLTTIYAGSTAAANPFAGTLELLVESRITDNAWFLFADPSVLPVLELNTLSGQASPRLEMKDGWDTLGTSFRIVHHLGANAIDYRGAYKNAGG